MPDTGSVFELHGFAAFRKKEEVVKAIYTKCRRRPQPLAYSSSNLVEVVSRLGCIYDMFDSHVRRDTDCSDKLGLAIAQAVSRRSSHRGGPVSSPSQVVWDLWWTKWHWGRFSPASSHSTDCSTVIYLGLVYKATVPSGLISPDDKKILRSFSLCSSDI
jgi:hypothetical protein